MKRLVVVVDAETKEWFEGEDLETARPNYEKLSAEEAIAIPQTLLVLDGKKTLGMFRDWKYFRFVESK